MERKTIAEFVDEECQKVAEIICEQYCKYREQFWKDQEQYDDENPTYIEHCQKCPVNDWYTH